jgi:hypothetical protein
VWITPSPASPGPAVFEAALLEKPSERFDLGPVLHDGSIEETWAGRVDVRF